MLKRTSLNFVNNKLKNNIGWKVLDIGCGFRPNPYATTIADIQDFSEFYKEKNFIKLTDKRLPFKNKEFDYVIASHVIEHVDDFEYFIKEIERISSQGYIELPTRLGDNLVFENKYDHIWWFIYDDDNNKLIASKKNQLVEPFITVSTAKYLEEIFRESLVMEIEWKEKVDYIIDNNIRNENYKKMNFLKIIKKYISKKIRNLYKQLYCFSL